MSSNGELMITMNEPITVWKPENSSEKVRSLDAVFEIDDEDILDVTTSFLKLSKS